MRNGTGRNEDFLLRLFRLHYYYYYFHLSKSIKKYQEEKKVANKKVDASQGFC